jgi:hypothetical protein
MLFLFYTNKNVNSKTLTVNKNKKESEIIHIQDKKMKTTKKNSLKCGKRPWENIDLLNLDAVHLNKVICY